MAAVETPSKVAASAFANIDLNTTKKASEATLLSKLQAAAPTKPVVEEAQAAPEDDVEEYRKRFVGDLDCEEKDEPLLKETNARFVLFPIKYHEVSLQVVLHVYASMDANIGRRFGKCTRRLRPLSGLLKRSTLPPIFTTGRTSSTTMSDTSLSTFLHSLLP